MSHPYVKKSFKGQMDFLSMTHPWRRVLIGSLMNYQFVQHSYQRFLNIYNLDKEISFIKAIKPTILMFEMKLQTKQSSFPNKAPQKCILSDENIISIRRLPFCINRLVTKSELNICELRHDESTFK